ncbi:23S rRNA (uracil(1939)-C(5))-methyltransferase RlmD [Anaerotignum sp.]|uniref:23S rRNA (uracil(1939)-C(5))-methyltransferase RlmD n=1 Tax=Anaerotignum sp. TaxID=2039241 RepID=UPI00332130F0
MSLPVEKNKIYEVTVDSLGSNGEGIGRIEGFTIFVEGALPEETVKVLIVKLKKSYGYGKMIEIISPSPYRVEPRCPVAKFCGGCQLQHFSYEGQLAYKARKVKDDLERIGGLKNLEDLPAFGMENPWRYRNKAQFPVGNGKEGAVEVGFYAKRSHRIVDTPVCYLQDAVNDEITVIVRNFMEEFKVSAYDEEKHKGLVRHILTRVGRNSGQIMVCIVINGKSIPYSEVLVERLLQVKGIVSIVLNVNKEQTNVILGKKIITLWGKQTIEDSLDSITFEISPLSFYQINPTQTEVLYNKAVEMADLRGEETVLDLYCGIGTISLFFAKKAKKIFGVEIIPEAIEDARKNAKRNGIYNATFEVGAAEEVIPRLYQEQGITADVIVVDPPRKGCEQTLLETIATIRPEKLVYVSCDPATLARDVHFLCEKGFQVVDVQVVDQFPMTIHVETIALITRVDK